MGIVIFKTKQNISYLYTNKSFNLNEIDEDVNEIIKLDNDEERFERIINAQNYEITTYNKMSESFYESESIININNNDGKIIIDIEGEILIDLKRNRLINKSTSYIFINGIMITKNNSIEIDDEISIDDYAIIKILKDNIVQIKNFNKHCKISLRKIQSLLKEYEDFPIYTNAPRFKRKLEKETIELKGPPEKDKKNLIKEILKKIVPTVITLGLTLLLAYFKPRGPYIIISTTATIITITFSIVQYISDKKEEKIFNAKRKKIYEDYLFEKRKELNYLYELETEILKENDLNYDGIKNMIERNSHKLYERQVTDEDFLNIRIGAINKEPTYTIKNPIDELKIEKEQYELDVQELYRNYNELKDVPRTISLVDSNIGLIGNKSIINEQIHSILASLYFYHSYHDINLIMIIKQDELPKYEYLRWLKHNQLGKEKYRLLIYNENLRDQMLSSIVQLLRQREEKSKEKGALFLPKLVFVISNYELIANHQIMEFLKKDPKVLGFNIIFIAENKEQLIDNVNTIVQYNNQYEALLLLENKVVKVDQIKLDSLNLENNPSLKTRKIGQLDHIKGVKSSLPKAITFLEMYGVQRVEELNVKSRWNNNRTYKTIKALIGKKSETDFIELDLHEKVHGPHGLVAGTTGSGKSEVIQTYILSLAINYSPYEVGFLLIDYKGGGMANLFKDMPHHLGSITNLDGYQSMRAMASIKSELKRRQKIFSENEVNHINGYNKLFEKNKVKEPLPHLFLISDEFAELKSEQPEFMKELVSASRIGRSLGVHLILATQKPAGVVDDQIWSNSKFKLCLKVAEEADSKELLKTPDAAYIVEPGRGYLKVGTDELYELFQSGWSGADYKESEEHQKDDMIAVVNNIGQKKIINEDMSKQQQKETEVVELDAVLEEVSRVYGEQKFIKVKKPWLPPLETLKVTEYEIQKLDKLELNLTTNIGIIDIPDQQEQRPLEINLIEQGNIGVFGAVQTGKTTTLKTIVLSLASQNNPQNLKFYILDFGNSALIQLKSLKHTSDYMTIEDDSKLKKFFKLINNEISVRKKKLSDKMASNFKVYNDISDEKMQAIIVVIDNYDALRDFDISELDKYSKMLKEGNSLGIYIMLSSIKFATLKMSHQSAITKSIQHYTTDKSEVSNSLGSRSEYELQEIQGRVQIKLDKPEVAHVNMPIVGETEKEIITKMSLLIESINSNTKYQNEKLPVMPLKVEYKEQYKEEEKIFIGLDYEDILPQYLTLESTLFFGPSRTAKTSLITNILNQVDNEIYILDDEEYSVQNNQINGKIFEASQAKEMYEMLQEEVTKLVEEFQKKREENSNYSMFDYKKNVTPKIIYINQADGFKKLDITTKPKFINCLNDLKKIGYTIIFELDNIVELNDATKFAKEFKQTIYTGDPSAQTKIKFPLRALIPKVGEAYLEKNELKFIKILSENK